MKKRYLLIPLLIAGMILASLGAAAGPYKYYVPEGKVSDQAYSFLNILNPGDEDAQLAVTLYYSKGTKEVFKKDVETGRKTVIDLSRYAKNKTEFGVEIDSTQSLVIEGVYYDALFSAGHGAFAADKLGTVFFFGQGYKAGGAESYLHILNPGEKEAKLEATLYYEDASAKVIRENIEAGSKMKLDLGENTLPSKFFGVKLTSSEPIAAQQSNYEKTFSAGSGTMGVDSLSSTWYFADGYTSEDASDFVILLNPGFEDIPVRFTVYYDDGATRTFEDVVELNKRKTVMLNNFVKELKWYSTKVESDKPVLAQQVRYDDSYSAGYSTVGANEPSYRWYFAEGYKSTKTKEYLALFNPGKNPADIKITIMYEDGTHKEFMIKQEGERRGTVRLETYVKSNKNYGIMIHSNRKIVAQQVHYDTKYSAGHGTVGLDKLKYIEVKPETNVVEEEIVVSMKEDAADDDDTEDEAYNVPHVRQPKNNLFSIIVSIVIGIVGLLFVMRRLKKIKENKNTNEINKLIDKTVGEKRKKENIKEKKTKEPAEDEPEEEYVEDVKEETDSAKEVKEQPPKTGKKEAVKGEKEVVKEDKKDAVKAETKESVKELKEKTHKTEKKAGHKDTKSSETGQKEEK